MAKYTPMMEQYLSIKAEVPDAFLFFRLGDFYELFFEDALKASRELEITLTGRGAGAEERVPMCGVPHHSAEQYITRLIQKGYKVAICEQVEDPAEAKGVVRREIVRIVTPGTVMEGKTLGEATNNYVSALYAHEEEISLVSCDLTTGEMFLTSQKAPVRVLLEEAAVYGPAEIIVLEQHAEEVRRLTADWPRPVLVSVWSEADELLVDKHFAPDKIAELTTGGKHGLALLLSYLYATQKRSLGHITTVTTYESQMYMTLDPFTRRNLELTETARDRSKKGSLLWLLDKTETAMGARRLRRWIDKPLLNKNEIEARLEAVDTLYHHLMLRDELRESLKDVYDLERLAARISFGNANARDLIALKRSLSCIPRLLDACASSGSATLAALAGDADACTDVYAWIDEAVADDPPVSIREGGMIRPGYDAYLDKLRDASMSGKQWIAELEQQEREATGIKSLKVGFNKVFGYYIEVTRANVGSLPEGRYERKQTLANAERFITPELKEKEALILEAENNMVDVEYELFTALRLRIAEQVERLQTLADRIAVIDALQSLATVAAERRFVRPHVSDGFAMRIEDGRHPVVEAVSPDQTFVANDTSLSAEQCISLITGPNMAGKSTYMRQTALIAIMAQVGSFVPARSAHMPIIDRIFTRIGAADDLIGGQSTFMMEMKDIQVMTERATRRSLVIIDELGRGTSTSEGMAIAQAVIEYLHDHIGCKTLVSTHFHELAHLEGTLSKLANYCMAVKESGEEVTFLRKLIPGAASTSYGVYCARIAGLPNSIIDRAYVLLNSSAQPATTNDAARSAEAEQAEQSDQGRQLEQAELLDQGERSDRREPNKPVQLAMFESEDAESKTSKSNASAEQVADKLRSVDLMSMTPLEAMNFLYELKQKVLKAKS